VPEHLFVADETTVEDATDELLAAGIGDGLPVVPPTKARWERTRAGVADPDTVLGLVPPLFGELTAAEVAYYAMLAGCRTTELPVVLAAVRACLEPEFNLLGVQTTTGTAAVVVVVHGPVVEALGFNPGTNVLGPGNRVNATVGRAVALTLAGVGGAVPGVTDMATTGQPGRYTFCLPEHPDARWPGLAARRGVDTAGGAVSVLAVAGTAEVLPRGAGGSLETILDPFAELLAGAALASGDPAKMASCEQFMILPPEVVDRLAGLGATVRTVQERLFERGNAVLAERAGSPGTVAASAEDLHPIVSGGPGIKMLHLPGWMGGARSVTVPIQA
jgi:hypothetical protein